MSNLMSSGATKIERNCRRTRISESAVKYHYSIGRRGAAGGYALARSPDEITLFDILQVIDPPEQPPRKKDKLNPTAYVLNVRAVWDRVVEAQQALLKETTLADLLAQSEGIQYVI